MCEQGSWLESQKQINKHLLLCQAFFLSMVSLPYLPYCNLTVCLHGLLGFNLVNNPRIFKGINKTGAYFLDGAPAVLLAMPASTLRCR